MSDAMRLVLRPGLDANEGETKHDCFRRLAGKRMQKILRGLDQLGHLSGPNYEYSEAEMEQMVAALRARVDEVERRLRRRRPEKREFAFEASPPACARGKL